MWQATGTAGGVTKLFSLYAAFHRLHTKYSSLGLDFRCIVLITGKRNEIGSVSF